MCRPAAAHANHAPALARNILRARTARPERFPDVDGEAALFVRQCPSASRDGWGDGGGSGGALGGSVSVASSFALNEKLALFDSSLPLLPSSDAP